MKLEDHSASPNISCAVLTSWSLMALKAETPLHSPGMSLIQWKDSPAGQLHSEKDQLHSTWSSTSLLSFSCQPAKLFKQAYHIISQESGVPSSSSYNKARLPQPLFVQSASKCNLTQQHFLLKKKKKIQRNQNIAKIKAVKAPEHRQLYIST